MKVTLTILFFLIIINCKAQDSTLVISNKMFDTSFEINLHDMSGWIFKIGNDTAWANPNINTDEWKKLKPSQLTASLADENGRLEGWFRIQIKPDNSLTNMILGLMPYTWAAMDLYIDGVLFHSYGNTGLNNESYKEYNPNTKPSLPFHFSKQRSYLLAVHFVDYLDWPYQKELRLNHDFQKILVITHPQWNASQLKDRSIGIRWATIFLIFPLVLAILFWLIYFQNKAQKHLLFIAVTATSIFLVPLSIHIMEGYDISFIDRQIYNEFFGISILWLIILIPLTVAKIFLHKVPRLHRLFTIVVLLGVTLIPIIPFKIFGQILSALTIIISLFLCVYYLIKSWKTMRGANWAIVGGLLVTIGTTFIFTIGIVTNIEWIREYGILFGGIIIFAFPLSLLVYISMWFKETSDEVRLGANKLIQVTEEKRELLENQNVLLEQQVKERTIELSQSLENLKSTQSQLIQSEKMASLGELTAGIAHEIQNPLNFVNNFSEVNTELIDELEQEVNKGNLEEVKLLTKDIKENEQKINHHGKRAGDIVKGMLQHSRTSSGVKEPTNINALADEYLRLAYHGLRAKDKTFNAKFETNFDETLEKINVVPQDIGRVILNLITNAFYVVNEKAKLQATGYEPQVGVSTKKSGDKILISVKDNGNGIPDSIKEKIFQPFFTTKPTGQGTGLGLSLSYDIVKAHGGELKVETKEKEGSEFIIQLPI